MEDLHLNGADELSDLLTPSSPNHYKVLNVSETATRVEIREAYLRLKSSMNRNDAAFYSLGEADTSSEMLREIEAAFCILENDESRRAYDRSMRGLPAESRPVHRVETEVKNEVGASKENKVFTGRLQISVDENQKQSIEELKNSIDESGLTGEHIEKIRVAAGLSRDDVYKVTRISPEILDYIESESFDKLPSKVYVRGFLSNYLRFLAFEDPAAALKSYMQRFDEWSQA